MRDEGIAVLDRGGQPVRSALCEFAVRGGTSTGYPNGEGSTWGLGRFGGGKAIDRIPQR